MPHCARGRSTPERFPGVRSRRGDTRREPCGRAVAAAALADAVGDAGAGEDAVAVADAAARTHAVVRIRVVLDCALSLIEHLTL